MAKRNSFYEIGFKVHDSAEQHTSVDITEDGGDVWIKQGNDGDGALLVSKEMALVMAELLLQITNR